MELPEVQTRQHNIPPPVYVPPIKPAGRQPDYKGEGIAVWVNEDKNGNPYLSVKILGNINLNAFKNERKDCRI